jgi:hypothetical protein
VERDDRTELLLLRERVHELAGTVAGMRERMSVLEVRAVRRNGPIVEEMRETKRAVERLNDETATRAEIKRELAAHSEFRLSTGAKLVAAFTGLSVLALQILQVVFR